MTTMDLLAEVVLNPLFFVPKFMRIEDKERVERPFILNPIQEDIIKHLMAGYNRLNVLKPGQAGVTSGIMAFFLHNTITVPGTTTVIIAHEEFITQRLLHKAQVFYDSIPREFKPEMHHSSSYEKTFPDINSTIYIGTARAYVFGRGEAIHNLDASEYAFWPEDAVERIMVPTVNRVPLSGVLIKESTANGEGNAFHGDWQASKRGELIGNAVYKNLFYPWWMVAEYRIPRGSIYALERDRGELDFTIEESRLMEHHALDEDQIRWRRRKIEEMDQLRATGESAKFFWQEFPEDDESCFLTAGDMVYDAEQMKRVASDCYRAPHSIDNFQVWYRPEPDLKYYVVIDPSQAKVSKTAITVWRFESQESGPDKSIHCATFAGLVGPELTAEKAKKIGYEYNRAEIIVEANSHGLAVVTNLMDYPNLYYRQDIVSGRMSSQVGWLTTPRTKPYMIQALQRALPNLVTHDLNLVSEMRNMRFAGDRAISVGDDDIHDTAAMVHACYRPVHGKLGYVGQAGWSDKWGR